MGYRAHRAASLVGDEKLLSYLDKNLNCFFTFWFGSSKDDHTCSQNLGLNHTLLAKTQLPAWFIENFSPSLPQRLLLKVPGAALQLMQARSYVGLNVYD